MPRVRDLKLQDYNISSKKYKELKYFCMQYQEKKEELLKGYGLKAISNNGSQGGNEPGKPTENAAVRNAILQKDIELIEQTAIEADSEIYQYIIKNVTEGTPYEYMNVPICRNDFYGLRRYFFKLLSEKR